MPLMTGWPVNKFGAIVCEGSGDSISGTLSEEFCPLSNSDGGLQLSGVFSGGNISSGKIIIIGDSITAYNGGTSIATPIQPISPSYDSKGFFNWANIMCGNYFTVIGNAGIGGQTSAQIAARFATDVLAYKSDWVCILAGTNDVYPISDTKKNLKDMYDAALSAGRRVIACTIPPNQSASLQTRQGYLSTNNWIVNYAKGRSGIVVANIGGALADNNTSWQPTAGVTFDGTHPSPTGAVLAGRMVYEAVKQFIPQLPVSFSAGDPANLITNPTLYGTGSSAPTTWNITGTTAITYLARADGLSGNILQLTIGAGGNGAATSNVTVDGIALSVGDKVTASIEFEVSNLSTTEAAKTQAVTFKIQSWNGSSWTDSISDVYWDSTYDNVRFPVQKGTFKTPVFTVPATAQIIQILVNLRGAGDYKLSKAAVNKVL